MSRRRSLAAALLLGALLAADSAGADELRVVPSFSAKGEYNSNLFFSENPKVGTYIGTVTPGVEITSRTERTDAGVSAYVPARWYTADTNLDKVDQLYQGRLGYRFSPALRISGTAGYQDQSNPDRFIGETGLAVVNRSFRYNGSAVAEYTASEKTAASASYTYEKYDFQNSTTSDSETHGGTVLLVRDLGQRFPGTKGRGMLGVSRSVFDTSKVTNYSAAIGVERAVHELWSVVADVGVRYTRSEFDVQELVPVAPPLFAVVTSRKTEGDFGWTVNVSAVYKGETTGGSLTLYHDVAAAPGLGSAVQRSAAVLDVRQRTTWELTPFFSAGYYLNRADAGQFSTQSINQRTVQVRPGVRYDANKDLFVEAAYQYTWLRDSAAHTTASQSVVYLMATLRYPLYE
jgi:Putative beta-barrel porin 2